MDVDKVARGLLTIFEVSDLDDAIRVDEDASTVWFVVGINFTKISLIIFSLFWSSSFQRKPVLMILGQVKSVDDWGLVFVIFEETTLDFVSCRLFNF